MGRRLGFASVVFAVLAASGCTASTDVPPSQTPAVATATASADVVTCTAFGDVMTIVANADAGLRERRMQTQEQQGWYRLATRVLDRVPTRGEGAVSDAVAELKDVAPAIGSGVMGTARIGSDEWERARQRLSEACVAADSEMFLEMFTGG